MGANDKRTPATRSTVVRALEKAGLTRAQARKARITGTYYGRGFRVAECRIKGFEALEVHHEVGYMSVGGMMPHQTPAARQEAYDRYREVLEAAGFDVEVKQSTWHPEYPDRLLIWKKA